MMDPFLFVKRSREHQCSVGPGTSCGFYTLLARWAFLPSVGLLGKSHLQHNHTSDISISSRMILEDEAFFQDPMGVLDLNCKSISNTTRSVLSDSHLCREQNQHTCWAHCLASFIHPLGLTLSSHRPRRRQDVMDGATNSDSGDCSYTGPCSVASSATNWLHNLEARPL